MDYFKHFNHLKTKLERNILGTKTLQEILADRESTAEVSFFRSDFDILPVQNIFMQFCAPFFARILISYLFRIFSCNLTRRLIPGVSKCPKWRYLILYF